MLAVIARGTGGPEVLQLTERPAPGASCEQSLVEVEASALNRADLLQARGVYPPPPGESDILGLEASGIERGTGRRVCCLLGSGGFSELIAVDKRMLMPIPRGFSFTDAAALPEVWLTAYLNLVIEGGLQAGESVLVHAGASGVGTAAIQLCKLLQARCIVTTRSAQKRDRCLSLGASHACVTAPGFADSVLEATDGEGVDVILDVLGGGDALAENMRCLKARGRLLSIALMGGMQGKLDLAQLIRKRQRIIGSSLRPRNLIEKISIVQRFAAEILPEFDSGKLVPVVDSVFKMSDIRQAAARLQSNETIGKVTLEW